MVSKPFATASLAHGLLSTLRLRLSLLPRERTAAYVLLGIAITFNLVALYPEVAIPLPKMNDGVMHRLVLQRTLDALKSGQDPTDPWLSQIVLGYPLGHYYQHLPYVLPAILLFILREPFSVSTLFDWTGYVLLSAFPLSIYWSMRRLGFPYLTAALGALAAPLLSTNYLFGFDYNSYLWRGFGLYTQLWGMILLPPALAQAYVTLRDGRGYFLSVVLLAATALSHLAFGYIALGSLAVFTLLRPSRREALRRIGRLALILIPFVLVTSYFLVPLVRDSAYLNRSVWDKQEKFDSFGYEWVLSRLVRGDLFDYGRFPALTILLAAGLLICLWRRRDERFRAPVALFALWLVLYFGRPTWGVLFDITPLSRELYLHRLIAGVHLGGILLIGIGLAAPWQWALARDRRWLLVPAALTVALLFPVYRERIDYTRENARLMRASRAAFEVEGSDLAALEARLRELPPGRIWAGRPATWGGAYRVGGVRMYDLLTQDGFDVVASLYHFWSLNGDVQLEIDEGRPEHYNLLNIRYVVAPRERVMPGFMRPIGDFGRHRLYQVETTGYFDLVRSDLAFVGDKSSFYSAAKAWLYTDQPLNKQHPALFFQGTPPDHQGYYQLTDAAAVLGRLQFPRAAPKGQVLAESVSNNTYVGVVQSDGDAMLVLKATYHPGWRATIDGAEAPTRMLMPSYVGVKIPPGTHGVSFVYRGSPLRGPLMLLGLLTLALVGATEWRGKRLLRDRRRLALAFRTDVAPQIRNAASASHVIVDRAMWRARRDTLLPPAPTVRLGVAARALAALDERRALSVLTGAGALLVGTIFGVPALGFRLLRRYRRATAREDGADMDGTAMAAGALPIRRWGRALWIDRDAVTLPWRGRSVQPLAWRAAGRDALSDLRVRLALHGRYLAALAVFTLLAGLPMLQFKLMSGHDSTAYLPRHIEFWQVLRGGTLIPRWALDFAAGYGEPTFNFNAPAVEYAVAGFHALGFSFIAADNLAALLVLALAGIGMYVLAGAFFGCRGGLVAAVAYLYAPYLLSRLYVSHALVDYAAFAVMPFAFWSMYRYVKDGATPFLMAGAISVALLQISSISVALMSVPALALLTVWLAVAERRARLLARGAWCLTLGLGLSAYFWVPAMLETDYVQIARRVERLNYRDHFLALSQLIRSRWGYGTSGPGTNDGMSFALGAAHLALTGGALVLLPRVRKASREAWLLVSFFLVAMAVAVFFTIEPSVFLWERLPVLHPLQFPWRFLSLVTVCTAFFFGVPFLFLPRGRSRLADALMVALIGAVFLLNFRHAQPQSFLPVKDADFRPEMIVAKVIPTTAREFEPVWSREFPWPPRTERLTFLTGRAEIRASRHAPNNDAYVIEVSEPVRLRLNTFYFPGWTLRVDGAERTPDVTNPQGLMETNLDRGTHLVQLYFGSTAVRTWSTRVSLITLGLLLACPLASLLRRRTGARRPVLPTEAPPQQSAPAV